MMATKRVSPRKKVPVKAASPELTENSVIMVLESVKTQTPSSGGVDPEVRRRLVAAEAYFRAERRGFAAGRELDDWVAAEAAVDSRLHRIQAA